MVDSIEDFYSADAPIASAQDDLLQRSTFARSIANAIISWKGSESLVIGLCGQWGAGKSSIKNMVLETIGSSVQVLQFNPWQWATQDLLSKAFFEEIALALGQADKSKLGRQRSLKFKYYGRVLQTAAHAATGLRSIIPYLVIAALAIGYSASFLLSGDVPLVVKILFWLALIVSALTWSSKFAISISEALETRSSLHEQTIDEQKSSLRISLASLSKPLLVVIDDIDRLTGPEVRELLQLVKANTSFPRLVFLLLYDRRVVEGFLNKDGFPGSEYLRKIVQVPFDVPASSVSRIHQILFAKLDKIIADISSPTPFDQVRWGNLFYGGLDVYFQDLRSVYRYVATLSFHVSLFKGASVFEVNTIDLIALETLRIFEPEVYGRLRHGKTLLAGTSRQTGNSSEKERVDAVIEQATDGRGQEVKQILRQLFPRLESIYANTLYDATSAEEWLYASRVCSPEKFDRYFQLSLADDDLSESELAELLDATGDYETFLRRVESLRARGLLHTAFERLDSYKQKIPLANSKAFLRALIDISDDLPDSQRGGLFTPGIHASRILYWYLMQDQDPSSRGERLRKAFDESHGLDLVASQLSNEEARESKGEADRNLLDKATRGGLTATWLHKVRGLSVESLLGKKSAGYLLLRWNEWGRPGEVQQWAAANINSPILMLKLIMALTNRGTTQGFGDKVAKVFWRTDLESVEKILSLEIVEKSLAQIERSNLSGQELIAYESFEQAMKRKREGKRDDGFSVDSDDSLF